MVMLERPLFRSLDQCLRWAFGEGVVRGPTKLAKAHRALMDTRSLERPHGDYQAAADAIGVTVVALHELLDPVLDREELPLPSRDPDLDRLPDRDDAPAQVGMILGFVSRQPRPERQHLIAKFAYGNERRQAQRELRDYLLPLIDDMLKPRFLVFMLVARFYGLTMEDEFLRHKALSYLLPAHYKNYEMRVAAAGQMVDRMSRDINGLLADVATRTEDLAYCELKARGVVA